MKYDVKNGTRKPSWLGQKHTGEYKQMIRETLVNRFKLKLMTDEHREKIRLSMLGKRHPHLGKPLSEEHNKR